MTTISLEDFFKYKNVKTNEEMLPEIMAFFNTNKNKFQKTQQQHSWRKLEQKVNDNWLIANKFNQTDDDKIYTQFRSILNKLSDSNFNELAKEITNLGILKQNHLSALVELIFNKAIIESKFSIMYAKLSKELASYYIKEMDNGKDIYFRELLINKCQVMFTDCVSYDPTAENKTLITKEMAIGCMTFIGELYNCELLTNKIINSCFSLLIMKIGMNKPYVIDCISVLMKTIGKIFINKCPNESKIIFEKLEKLVSSGKLSNKDKFGLMDLLDLNKSGKW